MNCEKNQLDFLLHCYVSHLTTSRKEHEYMMLRMPMVANYPSIQSFQDEKCQRIWCYATRWLSQIFRYLSITWWPPRIFFFFKTFWVPQENPPSPHSSSWKGKSTCKERKNHILLQGVESWNISCLICTVEKVGF